MTRLSAKGESARNALMARSTANAVRTLSPPMATGSNAATPRKTMSERMRSRGNAISSAIARSPVAWLPT